MKAAADAIRSGRIEALRTELEREPELARRGRLIVDAARFAERPALELLLARGADPDASYRGYRPLHALIQERLHGESPADPARVACLELLLARGADPEQCAAFPPAPALLIAAFTGERAYVERLLAAKARVDGFAACALARLRPVEQALEADPGFAHARASGGMGALHCCAASRMGHAQRPQRGGARRLLAIATRLLDAGADPNARVKGWSHELDSAYFAIGAHNVELTRLLLERGADATAALAPAVWNAPRELAELVLAHGAEIDGAQHDDNPLLNDLVRWGRTRDVLWLLERGASPDLRGKGGSLALHQAASRGNRRMLAALLAAGADRSARDDRSRTALDVAREIGKADVIAVLG